MDGRWSISNHSTGQETLSAINNNELAQQFSQQLNVAIRIVRRSAIVQLDVSAIITLFGTFASPVRCFSSF